MVMTHRSDDPPDGASRQEREEDLKATSDAIQDDVKRLVALERQKERLAAGDPEVDRLSDAAVDIADELARKTRAERQLADDVR
jgi:hypothetical protein